MKKCLLQAAHMLLQGYIYTYNVKEEIKVELCMLLNIVKKILDMHM